jgi:DNA-binding IclR family transcriptional regulator
MFKRKLALGMLSPSRPTPTKRLARSLGVSRPTAHRILTWLVENHYARAEGKRTTRVYFSTGKRWSR